jgi:hypothetical protein
MLLVIAHHFDLKLPRVHFDQAVEPILAPVSFGFLLRLEKRTLFARRLDFKILRWAAFQRSCWN